MVCLNSHSQMLWGQPAMDSPSPDGHTLTIYPCRYTTTTPSIVAYSNALDAVKDKTGTGGTTWHAQAVAVRTAVTTLQGMQGANNPLTGEAQCMWLSRLG